MQAIEQSTQLDLTYTTVSQDNGRNEVSTGATESTSDAHEKTVCLCLVHRPDPGKDPQFAESISDENSQLLADWYVTKCPTKEQADFALSIMRKAKQQDLWIACSGCGSQSDQPECTPFMAVVDFRDDNYTLRRLVGRAEHSPSCPFRLQMVKKTASNIEGPETESTVEEEPDLLKGRSINDGRARQPAKNRREKIENSGARKGHSLYTNFCHLMVTAGLHQIRLSSSYEGDRASLMKAAEQIRHKKNISLTLHDCLLVDPVDHDVLPMLFAISDGMWPGNQLPVGYVVIVCDTVHREADGRCTLRSQVAIHHTKSGNMRSRALLAQSLFSPECPVRVAGIQGSPVCGPYLVMLRAEKDVDGRPLWIEGIARPIVSRSCWLPVRSDTERDAHNAIRKVISELDAANIPHDIHFVLNPMKNDAGDTCEPDICARKLNVMPPVPPLLIETQNTSNPVYHERKVKQHQIMDAIGTLYIDERFEVDQDEADNRLISCLREYFGLPEPLCCDKDPEKD
jgi:hypothetical protein